MPTAEVSATEFCCTALAPVFWLACRMPWPTTEEVMLTAPLPLACAVFCEIWLPVTLAVLNDEPAPPVAFVVALMILVFVVVWLSVPPPTTESLRAAWMLFAIFVVLLVVLLVVLFLVLFLVLLESVLELVLVLVLELVLVLVLVLELVLVLVL